MIPFSLSLVVSWKSVGTVPRPDIFFFFLSFLTPRRHERDLLSTSYYLAGPDPRNDPAHTPYEMSEMKMN